MAERSSSSPATPAQVLIAGGGFAALEAALAVLALAKKRVRLTLVSPSPEFVYRPAATFDAFTDQPPVRYDLKEIAAEIGATYHQAAVEAVAAQRRSLRLTTGTRLTYDFLVLAAGARARAAIPGALTFRDQRDIPRFRLVLDQLGAGEIGRLVFAVPSRNAWSLPAYELAFLSARHAADHGVSPEIAVVTPERAPLAVFGGDASQLVADELEQWKIRFVGGSIPHSVRRDGSLALQFDGAVGADRVVAVPELHGPRIAGVPGNWSGFVPTNSAGQVEGLENVYAAGDMTTFPIKQGGIAAQQADGVAQSIAAQLGAPVKELHPTRFLRARLLGGHGALVLRAELDELGRPTGASLEHRETRQAPDLKVFGLYLTPYLSIYRARFELA